MKKVICIDDRDLPQGAEIVEGKEYEVEREFVNRLDQKTYWLKGIRNHGFTKLGMEWRGYRAERFASADNVFEENKNVEFQFN
jgi:hypothetical protein